MITMLGLFIVVTYVEQRLILLPNTAGKKELYGSNSCYITKLNHRQLEEVWAVVVDMCAGQPDWTDNFVRQN